MPGGHTGHAHGAVPVPAREPRLAQLPSMLPLNRFLQDKEVPSGWRHEAASADRLEDQLEKGEQTAHDPDLVMHLVLSHHGRFRGPGPVCPPEHGTHGLRPGGGIRVLMPWCWSVFGQAHWSWASEASVVAENQMHQSRFHRLNDRYGPYTLALVEAILRLADWDVSQELEQNHE